MEEGNYTNVVRVRRIRILMVNYLLYHVLGLRPLITGISLVIRLLRLLCRTTRWL